MTTVILAARSAPRRVDLGVLQRLRPEIALRPCFRAPSFYELYNLRFAIPGLDLDPETIDTYEISLGAEFTPSLTSRVTFFHNEGKIT